MDHKNSYSASYAAAGVDITAGYKAVELMKKHVAEYANPKTERGQCMLKAICEEMGFDSLGYQTLDGLLEAIGLDRDKVCTYCWTGKE